MRVAVWHNLPSGGGKRALYNHVEGLLEQGHYVESWCPDTADQSFLPLGRIIKENVRPLRKRSRRYHDTLRPFGVARELVAVLDEQCRRCAAEINSRDFDLLFAGACLFVRTSAIARYLTIPSVLYLGEPYRWFYEALPDLPWIAPGHLRPTLRGLARFAANHMLLSGIRLQAEAERMQALDFRRILVNSLYSREAILRTYNINARVCLLGVDVDKYRSTGEGREDFVLGVGTIYHGKGVDRAIRAVAEIPAIKRPQLVWVGNGAASTDLTEYRRLAASLGVTLRTMENVTDGEVISLMSRARAMVYPPRLEPFGLAPLEANACETAVAGVAEGGVRESVCEGVNGFLAAEDDPRLLAAALMRILETPEPAELGRRARAHVVEHWSLPHGTRNLIAALSTVARENRDKEHAS